LTFPVNRSLDYEEGFLYLQKVYIWQSTEENRKIKDREKVCVCIHKPVNTHTQTYKHTVLQRSQWGTHTKG